MSNAARVIRRLRRHRRWIGLGSLALFIVVAILDMKLQDRGSGIIPFELAFTDERASEILGEWGDSGRDTAGLSLWLDFGFLVLYGSYLALLMPGRLAVLPIAGACCDALENLFLLLTLGGDSSALPAGVLAVGKFGLVTATVGYLLIRRFRR